MQRPFDIITATRDIPLFIFGDHASRHIPEEYNDLGLTGEDLTRHIAWDIGTDVIVSDMATHFGCGAQIARISRLVIDLNRDTRMPCLIPTESDGTYIPGNHAVALKDREDRIARFHVPYHEALSERLAGLNDPLVVSVHSFTPKPDLGEERAIDIGLLVKHDEPSAEAFKQQLNDQFPEWRVRINEPYSAHILNHTIDSAVAAKGFRHLAIEVNQRLIDTDAKAAVMATKLSNCLRPLLQTSPVLEGA